MSKTETIETACWLALIASLGELAVFAVQKFVFTYRFIFLSRDTVWMTPLADAALFVAVAAAATLVARRSRNAGSRTRAVLLFATYASVLLAIPDLHPLASVLLALGLARATSQAIARRSAWFAAVRRRSWPVLALLVLAAALVPFARAIVERRAYTRLPPASPGAPNVIVVTLDTVSADSMSLYGYARPTTPRLQQIAERGVVFDEAVAPAPWTLPSHASMFTGRLPHELGVGVVEPLNRTYPTVAEEMTRHGYATGGFVANTVYASYEFGLHRGFVHYEDYARTAGQIILSSTAMRTIVNARTPRQVIKRWDVLGRKDARTVNRDFLSWWSNHRDRPIFAFLNYLDAHEPYAGAADIARRFGSPEKYRDLPFKFGLGVPFLADPETLTPQQIQVSADAYDGAIASIDDAVGELVDQLIASGDLDNTVLIITADHGEEFGEHGLFSHGTTLYWRPLHVPLMIVAPGRAPANVRVHTTVSLQDIAATVLAMANVVPGRAIPGRSLARAWSERGVAARPAISEVTITPDQAAMIPVTVGPMRSVVAGDFHYIRRGDGVEQLYDLSRDRAERRNVTAEAPAVTEQLRKAVSPERPTRVARRADK